MDALQFEVALLKPCPQLTGLGHSQHRNTETPNTARLAPDLRLRALLKAWAGIISNRIGSNNAGNSENENFIAKNDMNNEQVSGKLGEYLLP